MTKRAGQAQRRRARREAEEAARKEAEADHLNPTTSLNLELRAIKQGWLAGDEYTEKQRKLLHKLIDLGLDKDTPIDHVTRIVNTVARVESQSIRTMIAAEKAAKDNRPVVIVQQNNSTQIDTLGRFVDRLSPEEALDWLDRYGAAYAASSRDTLPPDGGDAGG